MYVHPQALCESDQVGEGTRIWAFAHVMCGAVVGAHCNIGEGVFVESGAIVGCRVTLKNQVMVWNGVTIGDDVFVGPGVIFTNDAVPRSPRMPRVAARYADVNNWLRQTCVEHGATLGAGAIILPGLTIGAFAFVGAGAVVTRDVRAHALVFGNPAQCHGWVCECGQRLDDAFICAACGATYNCREDRLTLREGD